MQASAVASGPDQLGQIGHYQLRERLGEGGFGEVYAAWDERLQRLVALKRLRLASADGGAERLMKEARLAASLQHAAFVRIHALEQDGWSQSIVMELVPGHTLRAALQGAPLEPSRALDITGQVAAAMQEAHGQNLVHGDLKPSNLMLEPSGAVRILDFGLARHIDPLATQTMSPFSQEGTIAYMSPERLQGTAPDPAGDIYALGIILYEMLTGSRPFADLQGLALAAAQMQSSSEQWPFGPDIAAPLRQLVLDMTAREPARRLPSMEAVAQRVAALRDPASAVVPANWTLALPTALLRRAFPVATAGAVPRRRLPVWARVALLSSLGAVLIAGAAWRWAPAEWVQDWAPYSEQRSLQQGMDGLRVFDRDGALEASLAQFDRVLAHSPGHAAAVAGSAIAYCFLYNGSGRDETWLQRADVASQFALKLDDQLALAYTALAFVQLVRGDTQKAMLTIDRALSLDPNEAMAWYVKIGILQRTRRYKEQRAQIDLAIQRFPQERNFIDQLGVLFYVQGDYASAEQAFRRSLLLAPDASFAYANMSAALLRQGREDDALHTLQQGLQIRPSSVLYSNLGTTLFARGDYVAAASAFEHAVSASRGGPNVALKWANLADTLRWIPGRMEDSRRAYRRALELQQLELERSQDDPVFLSRRGLYLAHLEPPTAALEWISRAVSLAPNNADVRFRAAVACELAGERRLAISHLRQAQELGYPAKLIASEPDLLALRRDPLFHPTSSITETSP
ncbi:protein kinase domain-containing protein [Oxalobacteraceae bacterium A2-2]